MTTHVNKVHHVTTITQVAKDLGEDDWLRDVANEMEIEDGLIWVCRRRWRPGVHRLRHREPDRARPDAPRKSGLAQALTAE